MKVTKPILLDSTGQEIVSKLSDLKDVLDNKMFTPPVLLDNKSITENGVYRASTEDAVDGYAKVTVDVAGGGGVDFENVMMNNISQAVVPENWEIPKEITSISDRYDYRNSLLDNKSTLKSVTLATGHTGLMSIGTLAFEGFSSLSDVSFAKGSTIDSSAFQYTYGLQEIDNEFNCTLIGNYTFSYSGLQSVDTSGIVLTSTDCTYTFSGCNQLATAVDVLTYNDGDKNILPSGTYESTALERLEKVSGNVEYLGPRCCSGLSSSAFTSKTFTNSKWHVKEPMFDEDAWMVNAYPVWESLDFHKSVVIKVYPEDDMAREFTNKPTLYDTDGNIYNPLDERRFRYGGWIFYVRKSDDGTKWWLRGREYMDLVDGLISLAETPPRPDLKWQIVGSTAEGVVFTDTDPISGAGIAEFSVEPALYDESGAEYVVDPNDGSMYMKEYDASINIWRVRCVKCYGEDENGNNIRTAAIDDGEGSQFADSQCSVFNLENLVMISASMFSNCYQCNEFNFPVATRVGDYAFTNSGYDGTLIVHVPICEYIGSNVFGAYIGSMSIDLYLNSVTAAPLIESDTFPDNPEMPIKVHIPAGMAPSFRARSHWAEAETANKITFVEG